MKFLNELKKRGYKITSQREAVAEILSSEPRSAEDIFQKLKKRGVNIDLVSVYRILELLVQIEIAREVHFSDTKRRYELFDPEKHHHHLVCNNCGDIEDMNLKQERKLIKDVENNTNFKIQDHSIELFGLCYRCQSL